MATAAPGMTREQVYELARDHTMTNVENLARALGSGKNTIYDDIAAGRWTATRVLRIGRKILIPTADILKLVGGDAA